MELEVSMIENVFGMSLFLPKKIMIFEIPYNQRFSGAYVEGTIQLVESTWCRPTLVHELLHATSFFVREPYIRLAKKIMPLIESATEFLTGYVLWQKHRLCYENWIRENRMLCSIQGLKFYGDGIRAFALLAEKTSISDVAEIYFWQPETSFKEKYTAFVAKHGLKDFIGETLSQPGRDSISAFIDALSDAFGEDIVSEYVDEAPLEYVLDYSRFET